MKIAFVTGCLEPGRDGVGDYTRLLAAECQRLGHEVCLLSLNDPYAESAKPDTRILRFSPAVPWAGREKRAKVFMDAFAPDCVSLQFVCYGFHPRGVDMALALRLRSIIGARPVQIMFHEVWIGAGKGEGLGRLITGGIQRLGIYRILRTLNVRVVHSSNAAYVGLLRDVPASILPMFGSIPVPPRGLAARTRGDTLSFGLFGTLHPVWPPEPLISTLVGTGKKIVIAHIGRIGAGEALWNRLKADYAGTVEFRRHGEQAPEKIAEFFRMEIDFGIATTPWALIGKSATVASMLEHGLPVIVNRDDWKIENTVDTEPSSPLLIKMDENLAEGLSVAQRGVPASRLPVVAAQFLSDIEKAL